MKSYAELTHLDDIALAREGWRRNDQGGLTKLKPGEKPAARKTWGIVGLVKGFIGGAAPAGIAAARMQICRACQAKDSTGKRLFRRRRGKKYASKFYCGKPRLEELSKLNRAEEIDGCGCELGFKTSRAEAACPLGKWQALSESDAPPLKLYDPEEPAPAKPPSEPSLEGATVVGEARRCGCGRGVGG